MKTNLLIAIKNIVQSSNLVLDAQSSSSNRINAVGDALETFIKDSFCNSLDTTQSNENNELYGQYFSYLGNKNNPPDIMIKNGDALEVKKIESGKSSIALNSSYPKDKLYSDNSMITVDCRTCEDWKEKDMLYAIGVASSEQLNSLWFIYGNCYMADKEIYKRIKNKISAGVNELADIEFSETKELGRVNRVDPLGITYLRIRGMWHIENPNRVFQYIPQLKNSDFFLNAIVLKEKYQSFPEEDRKNLESLKNEKFSIIDIKIKSPNNPAKMLDAKLITMKR